MAFFKEKRTGNLSSQTVVDWGKTLTEGMNSEVLTKHYQRKFDQKVKDLEATPQIFDTTLSFLEPKILERITILQNEYKDNASTAYNRPDLSDAAVNARQRNAAIIKEIAKMQAGIQSLQSDEDAFAENPGDFYPDEINDNLAPQELLVREAYTELINGDYKRGDADVVKDVYFTDGGNVMVDIEGLGPVNLNELRSFDQPTEGLKMGYIEKLAGIATTAAESTPKASGLQAELLGDVINNLNYYEKLELLSANVTISPEFAGGNIKDTLTPKEDVRYKELFRKLVKDADKHIEKGNWQNFFNPKVREAKNMVLNTGFEQPDVVQGIEDFVRDFTLDISNQFIQAGKKIQDDIRQQKINDSLLKSGTDSSKELKAGADTVIDNAFAALEKDGVVGTNGKYYKGYGTVNEVEITPQEFEKIYMRELGGSLSSSNEDIYFQDYIAARDSFANGNDMKEAMAEKLLSDTAIAASESDKHKAVIDLIADIINGEDNYGGGALASGSVGTYFQGGDRKKIFTKQKNQDGMTVYNINQEVLSLIHI